MAETVQDRPFEDCLGNPVHVGDRVAMAVSGQRGNLRVGYVQGLTTQFTHFGEVIRRDLAQAYYADSVGLKEVPAITVKWHELPNQVAHRRGPPERPLTTSASAQVVRVECPHGR